MISLVKVRKSPSGLKFKHSSHDDRQQSHHKIVFIDTNFKTHRQENIRRIAQNEISKKKDTHDDESSFRTLPSHTCMTKRDIQSEIWIFVAHLPFWNFFLGANVLIDIFVSKHFFMMMLNYYVKKNGVNWIKHTRSVADIRQELQKRYKKLIYILKYVINVGRQWKKTIQKDERRDNKRKW